MFTHNGDVKKHERIHTGVNSYACSTCGNMFIQNSDLKMHERRVYFTRVLSRTHVLHVEICLHKIVILKCMNVFTHVLSRMHVLHVESCLHKMSILKCMNVFIQVKNHNACSSCGKSFATNSQCKCHEKIHMAVKPYMHVIHVEICVHVMTLLKVMNVFTHALSCMHVLHVERCSHIMAILTIMNVFTQVLSRMHVLRVDIMFAHNGHIQIHERIHTCVKPYACSTCGNMFIQNSDLKMHERIHTGIEGALYRIWCGVNRLGDSGAKVV